MNIANRENDFMDGPGINTMYKIIDVHLRDLRSFLKNHELTLGVHRNAVTYFCELSNDTSQDLNSVIQKELILPLSDKVASMQYKPGSFVVVKYSGARIHFAEARPDTIYWIDSFSRKP